MTLNHLPGPGSRRGPSKKNKKVLTSQHHHTTQPHHHQQQQQRRNKHHFAVNPASLSTPHDLGIRSPHSSIGRQQQQQQQQQYHSQHHIHVKPTSRHLNTSPIYTNPVFSSSPFAAHSNHSILQRKLGFSSSPPSYTSIFSSTPMTYTPPTAHPITTTQRFFLNALFEKQRKMSWSLHRRKKMEMSADFLSRPTHRPARTESMDLIMKRAHDITLGDDKTNLIPTMFTDYAKEVDRSAKYIDMSKLRLKEQLIITAKVAASRPWSSLGSYLGLFWGQFLGVYATLKTNPQRTRKVCMDILDSNDMQTFHQVVDSYPGITDFLLAWGVTQAGDILRIPAVLLIIKLMYEKRGVMAVDPEIYDAVKYRFEIEQRFDHDIDMSKIDPTLHAGLVPHPGSEPPPRLDFYGRDRLRDYIPKDRIDLEYALFSWQRVLMKRKRWEQRLRRGRPRKIRRPGPRFAKVGFGVFNAR